MFSIPFQLHSNVIRDVMFLHESWPWCKGQNALLSVAIDGTAKVQNEDIKTHFSLCMQFFPCSREFVFNYNPAHSGALASILFKMQGVILAFVLGLIILLCGEWCIFQQAIEILKTEEIALQRDSSLQADEFGGVQFCFNLVFNFERNITSQVIGFFFFSFTVPHSQKPGGY